MDVWRPLVYCLASVYVRCIHQIGSHPKASYVSTRPPIIPYELDPLTWSSYLFVDVSAHRARFPRDFCLLPRIDGFATDAGNHLIYIFTGGFMSSLIRINSPSTALRFCSLSPPSPSFQMADICPTQRATNISYHSLLQDQGPRPPSLVSPSGS
jgi:hypothetical protein